MNTSRYKGTNPLFSVCVPMKHVILTGDVTLGEVTHYAPILQTSVDVNNKQDIQAPSADNQLLFGAVGWEHPCQLSFYRDNNPARRGLGRQN